MSGGLLAPWGSCGVVTMAYWCSVLEDSRSSVCPDNIAWVPLLQCVLKGCVFSFVLKVKSFLCLLKLFSLYSSKVNVLYVYLQETMP